MTNIAHYWPDVPPEAFTDALDAKDAEIAKLRALLREASAAVADCHDCLRGTDLQARIDAALGEDG